MTPAALVAQIRRLTPFQRQVLGCLAQGQDQGHPRLTLDALQRYGLITRQSITIATPCGRVTTIRSLLLPAVESAWWAWCVAHPKDAAVA